jgi:hypothetical protein
MVCRIRSNRFDEGPPDTMHSLWQVRALDFQGMGKSSAMGQEPTHTIRPASCRCRPIAASFHRLFLGGLLPSRARFRFAGCAHGIRSILSRQAHANSHTERSPLDSAHISCRLCCVQRSTALGQVRTHAPPQKDACSFDHVLKFHLPPITAYPWISILASGTASAVMVIRALPGKLSPNTSLRICVRRSP